MDLVDLIDERSLIEIVKRNEIFWITIICVIFACVLGFTLSKLFNLDFDFELHLTLYVL